MIRSVPGGLKRFFTSGVFAPVRFLARFLFRLSILPIYRGYLATSRRFRRLFLPAKNPFLYPLTHRYAVHTLIVIVSLLVVFDSLNAKATKADAGLEPQSPIAELAPPSLETEDEVVEGPIHRAIPLPVFGLAAVSPEMVPLYELPSATVVPTSLAGSAVTPIESSPGLEGIRQGVEQYAIEGGDTVSTIARKFGVSTNTVLWANNLDEGSLIRPGDKLTILPVSGVAHEVKSGDTLEGIVKKYSGDLSQTIEFNRLADASDIHSGDLLIVPGGEKQPAPVPRRAPSSGFAFEPFNIPPPSRQVGGNFLWPTTGRRIFQYFRFYHQGIDIDGNYSSPIYSAKDGVVEYVSFQRYGYGYHVIVNHGGGVKTLYGHASKIFVKPGQSVKRGQTIAMVGTTGRSTGTHLHYEIFVGGRKVNPLAYY